MDSGRAVMRRTVIAGASAAGPWVAEGTNLTKGGAVEQSLEGSCVAACGAILSGGAMSEAQFLEKLGEWANPLDLVRELNGLQGTTAWIGGGLTAALAVRYATQFSPIGAVLKAYGVEHHMVVIEAIREGIFLVRDPAIGSTYQVTAAWIEKYVLQGVFRR